jgi:hypothetical protein
MSAVLCWMALLVLAGAIFCGFKINRRATIDARKSAQLLQETKQRTMEIAALYDTSQDVSLPVTEVEVAIPES